MRVLICITLLAFVALAYGQTTVPEPTPSDDFDCPDREEGYYSHPTDCGAYYHCTNGLAWYRHCGADLYFNPITKLCDWSWNVDCEMGETNAPVTTPAAATTSDPELRGISMIDPNPDYECDAEDNGAFPHEEDCEKYYDCYDGVATLFTCTDIMLFDLTYDGCNYASDVDCGNRTRPGGYPTQKPKPSTVTAGTERPPFDCPELEGLFEDPEDCSGYWQCYGGSSWHHYCSFSLYFNPVNQVCDYLPNVDCGDRPILTKLIQDSVVRIVKNGAIYEVED